MASNSADSLVLRWIRKTTTVKDNEVQATCLSFLFVFILMTAYFVMRPVRDSMASDWSDAEVSFLWTLNFFISTALVALFGFVVSRINIRKFVPYVYLGFALSFLLFFSGVRLLPDLVWVDKAFYLWVSVFALFHVSVFWSFTADTYNKEQAGRLFSVIAAGASLGAIAGPIVPLLLSSRLGVETMMLISAVLLLLPVPIIARLQALKISHLQNAELSQNAESYSIGGNPLHGFKEFFSNPYLLSIGFFIILYTGIGSFIYFEQKNLLAPFEMEARTTIYAVRDVIVNTLTYVLAFFVTGRIVSRAGMKFALPLVPFLLIVGMLILAFSPVLIVAVGMHIVSKAGNYGLTRPAREMLFTLVSRESRFKTKPVIDIVAYRGGDVVMAWFFTALTQGLGFGLAAVAAVGAGIAAVWAAVGYVLARQFDQASEKDAQ